MSTPDEYSVTDHEGDTLIATYAQSWSAIGITVNLDEPISAVVLLHGQERAQAAEALAGDLLAGGDARRQVEDRHGNVLVVDVDPGVVTISITPAQELLGVAFAVELTVEQAGHVHEMLTRP